MILHHYDLSPFSEKIRLMLDYSGLGWRSAISPAMPPRPIVDPLAGGYRRIPVAQIGADIFCDTRVISSEIAKLTGKAELAMENCVPEVQEFVRHMDSQVFMAIPLVSSPLRTMAALFSAFTPFQAMRFIKDRAHIATSMQMKRVSRASAQKLLLEADKDVEARLSEYDFMFGDKPCIADFSSYHLTWFRLTMQGEAFLSGLANTKKWIARMAALGNVDRSEIGKEQVFQEARDAQPRKIPSSMKQNSLIGKSVEIKPTDYAQDSVLGTLVGADTLRWVVARESDQLGIVHVHFPTADFKMAAVR